MNDVVADAVRRVTGRQTSSRVRFWLSVGPILATLVVVDVLAPVYPGGTAFLLLLLPVMVASMIGGAGPGLLALVLGATGSLALALGRGHPWLSEAFDVSRLLLYVAEGGFVVVLVSALQTAVSRYSVVGSEAIGQPTDIVEPLTPREVEILRLAARGLSNDGIARELHLSPNTVKSHLGGAYGKLGAHNRAQAIGAGLRLGYLDAESLRVSSR
jgi:DNA-binding CsgD family transcriptional regulator